MEKQIYNLETKEVDTEKYTLEAIFSSDNEDRHGDIVLQNWDLRNFKKNPVILNSHTYGDASEVIGKAEKILVKDGKLEGKIKFAVKENPKAKVIFDLYAGGFLNAFSVGFMPLEFDEKNRIKKSELLEVSAVSVPANAIALAKAKGIDIELLNKKEYENNEIGAEETEPSEPVIEPEGGADEGITEDETDSIEGEIEISEQDKRNILEEDNVREDENSEDSGSETVIEEVKKLSVEEKKQLVLNKIAKAVKILGELNTKVRTPHKNEVRAKNYALINKAIRNLINEKKKI